MAVTNELVDKWKSWIESCKEVRSKLTSWESDFIDDIEYQLEVCRNLTIRQAEILENIYAKKSRF